MSRASTKSSASKSSDSACCNFCGKSRHEVKRIIAGPSVYICESCVAVCSRILEQQDRAPSALGVLNKNADEIERTLILLRALKAEGVLSEAEYKKKARLIVSETKPRPATVTKNPARKRS